MNFEQADALNEVIRAVGVRHRALSIAALAPFGIHPGHKLVLFELDTAGPRTQAQLAAATGFEPPTITLSVRQLEEAGLVARRPSPTDRRATLVELSDKGRTLLPELKAAWCRVAEQTVAGFTALPLDQLTDVLADLAASLDASHDRAAPDPFNEPAPALPRTIAVTRPSPPATPAPLSNKFAVDSGFVVDLVHPSTLDQPPSPNQPRKCGQRDECELRGGIAPGAVRRAGATDGIRSRGRSRLPAVPAPGARPPARGAG